MLFSRVFDLVRSALHFFVLGSLLGLPGAHAATRVIAAPVPDSLHAEEFSVTVNGKPIAAIHAASSYDAVSFDANGPVDVAITASDPGFWNKGVDIQPWRLGLRPQRDGQTIRFRLQGPQKLSIGRPGDYLNHARMLFLFAGTPPPKPPHAAAHVRVIPAGEYHESLNPKSGDTIYLEPGAFVYGSLNLFNVENVKILGRGTLVYEGKQDPASDEGWMQKPDWHCIGSVNAKNVEIHGLTCLVRARTWSIQMKDSNGFLYDDLRVIGGNPGNANQDGMDWLGGGDTTVRDSFLRASDDVFALQGNWDGYKDEDFLRPGHDVRNILIEHSVVSTSISNIVRAQWPRKIFNSSHFTMRDSDVLHGGIGACGQTFGLLGFWGANGSKGIASAYTFENIFLDNWYSLAQIEQQSPGVRDVVFRNIWALDQPPLAESTLGGDVDGVVFQNVKLGQKRVSSDAEMPLTVAAGTRPAQYSAPTGPEAAFTVSPTVFKPGETIVFEATKSEAGAKYEWRFGDGTQATGRKVAHIFADGEGTQLDGSGRYRVLLRVTDRDQREDWAAQNVVAVSKWHEATKPMAAILPGLHWQIYPGTWTGLPDLSTEHSLYSGDAPALSADAHGFTRYVVTWDGLIDIPADGGYTFNLLARDGARLLLDGVEIARTGPPFAQVCGAPGNAVRMDRGTLGLRAGTHTLRIESLHTVSDAFPRLLWEGPGLPLEDVPAAAFRHARTDSITSTIESNRE